MHNREKHRHATKEHPQQVHHLKNGNTVNKLYHLCEDLMVTTLYMPGGAYGSCIGSYALMPGPWELRLLQRCGRRIHTNTGRTQRFLVWSAHLAYAPFYTPFPIHYFSAVVWTEISMRLASSVSILILAPFQAYSSGAGCYIQKGTMRCGLSHGQQKWVTGQY